MKLLVYVDVDNSKILTLLYIKQHIINDGAQWYEIPYKGFAGYPEYAYYNTGHMGHLENRYTLL